MRCSPRATGSFSSWSVADEEREAQSGNRRLPVALGSGGSTWAAHPYGPHTSRLTPLAFRLRALADHTLDVMDNRRGADHSPPAPVRPGKWGAYLLGVTPPPSAPAPPPERPVEGGRPS
jgi:hypothetical protein